MSNRRVAEVYALVLVSVLVAVVALLWARPAVASPSVDCGPLDQVACDRAAAELIAGQRQRWEDGFYDVGLPPGLPVLYVEFGGYVSPSGCISNSEILWPGGGMVAQSLC